MKIAVLMPPQIRNIGNSFIAEGGVALIKKVFPEATIEYVECLESSNKLFNYRSKAITPLNRRIIEDSDWLFVVGGSCLSRYMEEVFEEIKSLKVKKILLGAGFYENMEKETEMYKDLPEHFEAIFTRDMETTKALIQNGKYDNIYSGLDMAFWMDEVWASDKKYTNMDKPYSVINIDSPERGIQERLYKEHENSIISRNDSSMTTIFNSDLAKKYNCFVAERPNEYIKLYANAKFVATNRIHTFLTCILFDTPCQPFIDYTASYERFFLFKQIGLEIETAKVYTSKDYKEYKKVLRPFKFQVEDQLKNILQNKKLTKLKK